MKLFKFLMPMLLGIAVMTVTVGCEKKDETPEIPVVEKATAPKYEKPKQTNDGFVVPDNVVLEGGELKEVEK